MSEYAIRKIISGGQTGVDRAALDFAIHCGIPHGGWCPKGRLAEDGIISRKYNLHETDTADYSERTKLNLMQSDATLVLVNVLPLGVTDGTVLTINELRRLAKPHLVVSLEDLEEARLAIVTWLSSVDIKVLNIAGPRESQVPGIYDRCLSFLIESNLMNYCVGRVKRGLRV